MSWGIAETAPEIEKIKSESADYLNGLNSCGVIDWNTYNYAFDFYENLLIKAYEQGRKDAQPNPCDDAVSREEVLNCLEWQYPDKTPRTKIMELPPVTPKQRTGKWIPVDSYTACGGDEATWMAHGNPVAFYYCSECKKHAYAGEDGNDILSNFCPNCGAKMEGESNESD